MYIYDQRISRKIQKILTIPRWCFFCGSFLLFMFRVCNAVLSVHCRLVVTCWEWYNLLVLLYVMLSCVLSLFNVVSWVRCGTWLYRFLIFAFFLILMHFNTYKPSVLLWNIGKQCRTRSDAAHHDVWSGSTLFLTECTFKIWMELNYTDQQPLNLEWIRPKMG